MTTLLTYPEADTVPLVHDACILHGDIHVLRDECRTAARQWKANRGHLDKNALHESYQAEVERKILDSLARNPL